MSNHYSSLLRLGLCVVVTVNGYSGALLSGLQALPSWNEYFDSPKGNLLGLYTASYFLPSIVTAFLGDFLAHRYGRRPCIAIGMLIILVGACLNAAAQSVAMWVAGQFPAGKGIHRCSTLTGVRTSYYWRWHRDRQSRCSGTHSGDRSSSPEADSRLVLPGMRVYRHPRRSTLKL